MPLNIAILASGRGSNAKAIHQAILEKHLDAQIQCLICNIDDAPVVDWAHEAGIPTHVIPHVGLDRQTHEAQVLAALSAYSVDYLVLAGYMRLMTSGFLRAFAGECHYRIVNIHPSLLPAFPGTHGYEDAFAYGVKLSGVTVHFVDEGMDDGPILLQESFPRLEEDTLEDFKARGLALEHQVYPKALQLLAENRILVEPDSHSQRPIVKVKAHALC